MADPAKYRTSQDVEAWKARDPIKVIGENYSMLSDEVRIQHSNFLEWVVIILIAFELVFMILSLH